ncbi:hypothetical protein AVT69_gp280 [Pseudomonas phage PhiPA3]|uniref:Uncharacterized protein 282 n=1 Tax=Pseudomonas phage PhiPA3 TaxID=998086 RepID=F8SJB8_BPPA3|nr:hypothetical protein AVT69_gp280 [Pseudomonas phage PhiPA3]AEH03705.1 hypothetical protein [Pseudomonas phage PhiPA3]
MHQCYLQGRNMRNPFSGSSLFDLPEETPEEKLRAMFHPFGGAFRGEMKSDHGERTNRKIKDQPFYQRGPKKQMRKY